MFFKKKSIIFPWLLSYIAILLVPVLTGTLIYVKSNQTIVGEINRSNNLILSKVQKDVDTLLKDANRLSVEIAFNPQVQELLTFREPLKAEQYFTIYKAFESLKVFKSSNRWNDYFVYIKETDTIITADLSNSSEAVYRGLKNANGEGYADWITFLDGFYQGNFMMLDQDLVFIRSIPIGKSAVNQGNVVIFLDQEKFWADNAEDYLHNGAAVIMDSNNQVLASTRSINGTLPVAYSDLVNGSGVLKAHDGDQELVVSYISSGATDWKYMILMPEDIYWDKLKGIKEATLMSLCMCLIIGCGLAYVFVRHNYSPVRGMLKMFEEKKHTDQAGSMKYNEFDFMQRSIRTTLLANREMGSRLWRQKSIMRDHLLEKLLKGRKSAIPFEQLMDLHEIVFMSDGFAVVIMTIDDYNNVSPSLVHFAVINVSEELACKQNQGFAMELDHFVVCLFNFREAQEPVWRRELSEFARQVQAFIEQSYRVQVTISLSAPHTSISGITKAYYEALEVMEFQSMYCVKGIMDYNSIELPSQKGEYYYSLEKEQALMNCIKLGDYVSAETIIDEVFQENLEGRKLPLKLAKCLFVDLAGTMMKTINGLSAIYDNAFLGELNPIDQLLSSQTVGEMKIQLKQILRSICDSVGQKQTGKRTNEVLNRVKEIIAAQYNNVNLSIASIAEQIGLHPAYVSKLYKDGTGASLQDDIGRYRIEQAKQIMKEQGINMEAVALMVGYSNVRTFRRVFAKYEGVTPGKYADIME